jgi:hypothetical protein
MGTHEMKKTSRGGLPGHLSLERQLTDGHPLSAAQDERRLAALLDMEDAPRARMAAATHHGIKWSRIACATAWVRVRTPSLPWAFLR